MQQVVQSLKPLQLIHQPHLLHKLLLFNQLVDWIMVVLEVTVSGGTLPYSYLWNEGSITAGITNLAPGNYTVTVSDAGGCSKTETVTINSSSTLNTIPTSVQPTCGLDNGSAGVTVSGGTLPYSYLWNDGSITAGITNLAPGTYTVTVTDAAGCSKTETITINSSSSITSQTSFVQPTCGLDNNGSAGITVSGGTLPYAYLSME